MNNRKYKLFYSVVALAMTSLFVFSRFETAVHYQEFHTVDKKDKGKSPNSEKLHSENCVICHSQAVVFVLADFSFRIENTLSIAYRKDFGNQPFIHLRLKPERPSGRAPPFFS